jgi:long-chain fatty acid transport protein
MMLNRATRSALAVALLGLPALAGAQAFGLNEIGSCALARGFAVTGAVCDDASTIYWNPGAMPKNNGLTFLGGAAIIKINGSFTRDTSYRRYDASVPTSVVPHVFLNYRKDKMAYGVGVYVPYGLTSQWPDNFPGRFSAVKASLQTIYVQPNFSYQITDNWSIGGGPVIGHSSVELTQAVDLSTQLAQAGVTFGMLGVAQHTEFARATLKGSAMGYGFDVGAHGKIDKDWEMGLRFLSQVSFAYDNADATFVQTLTGLTLAANNPLGLPAGTPVDAVVAASFTGTGPLTAQKVKTSIRHPGQFQIGFGYNGLQNTTISADYAWVGWHTFRDLPVNFQGLAPSKDIEEDYNNTSSIRLGAEHRYAGGAALRFGLAAAASAAPAETVTPLLPEMDRELVMIGGSWPLMRGLALDAAYSHLFTQGSRGRLDERSTGSTTAQALALNNGAYTLSANIFSFSLKYAY